MSEKMLNLVELANESFVKDLTTVLSTDPQVLVCIADKVNTHKGFHVRDEDAIEVVKLLGESGLPLEKANDALSVLRHIFKRAIQDDVPVDTVLEEIKAFCDARGISGFESHVEALREILTPKPAFVERMKFVPFASGVERNLESISGVVELRGVFKSRESDEIIGYAPVVIARLTCSYDEDEDKQNARFTFQLSEKSLNRLSRALEKYKRQLDAVKKAVPEHLACFDDIDDIEYDAK